MKARDDGEGLGRLHGDVGRAVRAEAERGGVDARDGIGRGGGRASGHGEAVDAVAIAEQLLELIEVQPDAILAARDLGGIGAPLDDAGDDGGVAGLTGPAREHDAVADAKAGVGGEAAVDGERARSGCVRRPRARVRLLRSGGAEGEGEQEECGAKDHGDAG